MRKHSLGMRLLPFPLCLVLLLLIPAASAQTIQNPSFEAVQLTSSPFKSLNPVDIPGWTHTGNIGDGLLWAIGYSDGAGSIATAGQGNQFVTMGGGAGQFGTADWSTTITGLIAGDSYVLSFMTASETIDFPQSLTVSFTSGSSTGSEVFSSPIPSANYWRNWVTQNETFVATDTSAVVDFSASTSQDMGLDNVSVAAAATQTPEPASLLLLGSGLLGMAGAIRKKLIR